MIDSIKKLLNLFTLEELQAAMKVLLEFNTREWKEEVLEEGLCSAPYDVEAMKTAIRDEIRIRTIRQSRRLVT